MGRPKALLRWGDTTLIAYQVQELRAAGVEDVVVVLGHAAEEVRPHVPTEARVVVNEAYWAGRAGSLRAGARALADDADPIVVLNVDQPRPREVLRALLQAHRASGAAVTVPTLEGKRGHPPVLAGGLLGELRAASEEAKGLRGVIAAHEESVREVPFGNPIVRLDVNTSEEYERALREFGPPSLST